MFKTLLRTLSALSIVTITASAGFAVHEADDPVIDCADPANTYVDDCRADIKPVTTDVWKDSFESAPPPVEPNPTSRTDQFVLPADSLDHYTNKQRVNLKFDANNDGTDTIVGSSIFYMNKTGDKRNFYAGIRIGADLGAPIVEAFPEVVWKTRFKAVGTRIISKRDFYINEIFDLTVKFIGTSDGTQTRTMGEISGYIQQSGYYGFKIDAQFNDDGVITTGTGGITYGRFENAGAAPTETVVGKLTGIIGDRGALGAFHSAGASSDQILGFAGGFRANGFSEDALVALRKCVLDPFHGQCSEDKFDDLKEARIELCIEGDKASADSRNTNPIECHNAVLAEGCILNPFQATCVGEESDFNQYSEVARTNRIAFCDSSVNAKKPFCTVGTIVTDVCADDPFNAICGGDYDEPRNTAVQTCLTTGVCTDRVLARPNAGTWEHGFKTDYNPEGLTDGAGTISAWDQFLKNIEDAQTNSNIEIYHYDDRNNTSTYQSLNLSAASFSGIRLGGDAEDGIAYFTGRARGQYDGRYSGHKDYAGIFSTTDLGAPVTDEEGTASWVGSFRRYYHGLSHDFVLEIDFDSQSIEAFIFDHGRNYGSTRDYHIKAGYYDNGVIRGTVIDTTFKNNNRYRQNYTRKKLTLMGLIGKEGAVGVFYSGGFVARPADLVIVDATRNKSAEDSLNTTCAHNPFNKLCFSSNHRKTRIDECITGNNAGTSRCTKAIEYENCIRNPFDEECETFFVSHNASPDKPDYQVAQERRSAFCNITANEDDDLCMGANRVALCSYDPFNAICSSAIYDNARKAVCKAEPKPAGCTDAHEIPPNKVTTASWLYSFYKDDGFVFVLPTEPDSVRPRNQFLQGTAGGLDNGPVEIRVYDGVSYYGSLNLDTATFDGLELGRDKNNEDRANAAADGVAFFSSVMYQNYAGIFSGTDLGAPLVKPTEEADMTATWYGQFQANDNLKTDFTLDIKFNAQSTDGSVGTVEAFVYSGEYSLYYLLKGKFDNNGVISGTVADGWFPNHDQTDQVDIILYNNSILTGLIGTDGAVGVFTDSIRGGFVAVPKEVIPLDPNVKYSDWLRSFGNKPKLPFLLPYEEFETEQTLFLQGTGTGLGSTYYNGNVLQPSPLTLADVRTDGEVADGVAYMFRKHYYAARNTNHYSGLLSGTHLGVALPTIPAGANGAITAIWDGKLGLIADGSEIPKRDIDLTVNFTNKEISYSDAINGAHFVDLSANWESGVDYDGVLKGTITYNPGAALDNLDANSTRNSAGIVTGLIGQDGAVGAFRSYHGVDDTGTNTPFAGGFVAVPVANYANWVHSFGATGLPATPNLAAPKNEFLQSGGTTLSDDDFTFPDPASLDGTSSIRGERLSGEAADGVAFSRGTREIGSDFTDYYYAEISSTTELGRPLSQTSGRAIARGHFKFLNTDIIQKTVGFDLKITFDSNGAGNINAFISIRGRRSSDLFYLAGTFDVGGNIRGDIYNNNNLTETTTLAKIKKDTSLQAGHGTLRGLIGQDGAVGAFISTAIDANGYAGGFVTLSPQADISIYYLDWVNSSFAEPLVATPTIAPTTLKNQFLKDGDTSLPSTDFTDEKPGHLNLATATFGGASLDADGDDTDGVSFFRGTRGGEKYFYAGITSTTNLGAPIIDDTKDGNWKGRLKIVFHDTGVKAVDFMLNVTFGSTTPNAAGNISATIAASDLPINNPFVLTGTFDTRGVIKGTASNLVSGTNGLMTGLIGQDGAVGAFISNNPGTNGYSGGFVAVPPAEPASP